MRFLTFIALTQGLTINQAPLRPMELQVKIAKEPTGSSRCTANKNRLLDETNSKTYLKYVDSTEKYSDPSFMADDSSLYWKQTPEDLARGNNSDVINMYTNSAWKRPSELVKGKCPSLWGSKGVRPNGVKQGRLGDCWFLAAGSAIAEFPERLQSIFLNEDYSASGIFGFRMYYLGKPVEFNIDDRLAVSTRSTPFNADKSENHAWWMPLLEKAYAKFNINYLQLNGGNEIEALRTLTGMPVITYKVHKHTTDEFFDLIHEGEKKNYIMTGGCMVSKHNIVDGHAYSVISATTITTANGKKHRLVQVRNPWGAEQYNGPWSDKDDRWTPELLKQLGRKKADDGFFYMPIEIYVQTFVDVTITKW